MVRKGFFVVLFLCASCGIDNALVNVATKDKSTFITDPADNIIVGLVPGAPRGTPVYVHSSLYASLEGVSGQVGSLSKPLVTECKDSKEACGLGAACRWNGAVPPSFQDFMPIPDDIFDIHLKGDTEYSALRLEARWQGGQRLGIVPKVRRQANVLDPEGCYSPGDDGVLSVEMTAGTLLLTGKALQECKALQEFPAKAIRDVLYAVKTSRDDAVRKFVDMVRQLQEKAGIKKPTGCAQQECYGGKPLYPFRTVFEEGATICDLLDKEFLEVSGTAIKCEDFTDALLAAWEVVKQAIKVCYAPDRITVVFMADMREGVKDGNCEVVDHYKWATYKPNKTVYFTGAVHKTTPVCGIDGTPPYCLDKATVDEVNQMLGNWVPNQIEMFDDGTHGDAVKGDKIYTVSFELPYFDPDNAPDKRGVRLGYKYTFGEAGQGWTGSEEWPGNQRLLELKDVNGDGLVVRFDVFGDEATNKDKANLLKPSKGGCGTNYFENEVKQGCAHDTRERQVDTDGDCVPDMWPKTTAAPVIVDCPE